MAFALLAGVILGLTACETGDDPALQATVARENTALACREYATGADAFTSAVERGQVSPAHIERARVVRNQVGPLCEHKETARAEIAPAVRRGVNELLLLELSR